MTYILKDAIFWKYYFLENYVRNTDGNYSLQLELLEPATILLDITQIYAKKTTELTQQLMGVGGPPGRERGLFYCKI